MPTTTISGLRIEYEVSGDGEPVVLVHGSWGDLNSWQALAPELPQRVIRYSRRGHSGSDGAPGQGRIAEDVADLAALIETLAGDAHVVGNSLGAEIALRMAIDRPELVRSLALHEPGFWSLAPDDPAVLAIQARLEPSLRLLDAGEWAEGARLFAEEIFGVGAWDSAVPDALKRVMVANAPTFVDEERAPDAFTLDTARLPDVDVPTLLTMGDDTIEACRVVTDRLAALMPHAERVTIAGAGHVPHRTHPHEYAAALRRFWAQSACSTIDAR